MEAQDWGESEKYKCKLENKCNKQFIRCQKTFMAEKSKTHTKKIKDIDNKLHELKECIEKIKKIKI